jgi:menaquinol-cytochrome c reductase iron-sulfur subunit
VGFVVSWTAVGIGGAIAALFGFLWARDVAASRRRLAADGPREAGLGDAPPVPAQAGGAAMPHPAPGERFPRSKFLEGATLGLGAVIGGAVTVPAVGFALAPPFVRQKNPQVDLGPIDGFTQDQWYIAHFELNPKDGEVTRRTAYIRYNGLVGNEPSFTIISNRCAHLGCPVQPNGLVSPKAKDEKVNNQVIQLIPVDGLSGFGCPCHGGAYDTEGNRTAGPPVRGLDRYYFLIRNGHLVLSDLYSVKTVAGTGGQAKIKAYPLTNPGDHVGDWEAWLWPLRAPH